jgi:predicted unusual protein kinase regulating ubiquinone biosynthesis (AarF/ABC1/UbiB family)
VIGERSSGRVLTSELAEGMTFERACTAPQSLRDSWGEVLLRFAWGVMWRDGWFNADPNPGNYLFHADGTVTFLDFGCVKQLTGDQLRRAHDPGRSTR